MNFVQTCIRQVSPLKAPLIRQQLLAEREPFWTIDHTSLIILQRVQFLIRDDLEGCEIRSSTIDIASVYDHQVSSDASRGLEAGVSMTKASFSSFMATGSIYVEFSLLISPP